MNFVFIFSVFRRRVWTHLNPCGSLGACTFNSISSHLPITHHPPRTALHPEQGRRPEIRGFAISLTGFPVWFATRPLSVQQGGSDPKFDLFNRHCR